MRRALLWRWTRAAVCPAGLLVASVAALLLGGCGGGGTGERVAPLHDPLGAAFPSRAFEQASGTRAEALAALDSMQRGALRRAFEQLRGAGYRRHVRTEQRAADGAVVAFKERTVHHRPGRSEPRVVRSDSAGTFDFGTLGSFVSASGAAPAQDLAQQILSEEPSFLSRRNRYAFAYRLLPDTSLPGGIGTARVVAVRARPDAGGDPQAVRRARLYLDAGTRQLVALRLHRRRHSMLFDEDTRQFVRLRRAAATDSVTTWVPAETRFATRLDMPLRPGRRFRTTATYDAFRQAPPTGA
ncbi:MAG: hypothetical protein BRD48_03945 [Bacteroidetes bacterium QS_9_68_14]|nr:MAG: hypothetical protein BRD48_03945 [Bacteroidetes bacterium QS_9_68_14]